MPNSSDTKRDFFISFNTADRPWAAWIAWVLEEAGYSVWFQDWDFKGNFVLEMDKAHQQSRRTIAVLSPDYLASRFAAPEWAARFAGDAKNEYDLLIPIRVRKTEVAGLLSAMVYVDMLGIGRDQARQRLLDRVAGLRLKPKEEPFFPGEPLPDAVRSVSIEPRFPASTEVHTPLIAGLAKNELLFVIVTCFTYAIIRNYLLAETIARFEVMMIWSYGFADDIVPVASNLLVALLFIPPIEYFMIKYARVPVLQAISAQKTISILCLFVTVLFILHYVVELIIFGGEVVIFAEHRIINSVISGFVAVIFMFAFSKSKLRTVVS